MRRCKIYNLSRLLCSISWPNWYLANALWHYINCEIPLATTDLYFSNWIDEGCLKYTLYKKKIASQITNILMAKVCAFSDDMELVCFSEGSVCTTTTVGNSFHEQSWWTTIHRTTHKVCRKKTAHKTWISPDRVLAICVSCIIRLREHINDLQPPSVDRMCLGALAIDLITENIYEVMMMHHIGNFVYFCDLLARVLISCSSYAGLDVCFLFQHIRPACVMMIIPRTSLSSDYRKTHTGRS